MRAVVVLALLALVPLAAPALAEGAGWPPLASAQVRPGMQAFSSVGQCTSNFVYTSPDNATLYIGLAAHCVGGVGERVTFQGVNFDAQGTVAYTSWAYTSTHDFALVRIDDADRDLVHPAVVHFGGPTGLANSQTTATGDKVISHGASGLRPFASGPTSWKEGYLLSRGQWQSSIYTVTPGIFGDSGSAVMLADGSAHSVLVTISYAGGTNGVTNLDKALDFARSKGVDARVATWPLLDGGILPAPLG